MCWRLRLTYVSLFSEIDSALAPGSRYFAAVAAAARFRPRPAAICYSASRARHHLDDLPRDRRLTHLVHVERQARRSCRRRSASRRPSPSCARVLGRRAIRAARDRAASRRAAAAARRGSARAPARTGSRRRGAPDLRPRGRRDRQQRSTTTRWFMTRLELVVDEIHAVDTRPSMKSLDRVLRDRLRVRRTSATASRSDVLVAHVEAAAAEEVAALAADQPERHLSARRSRSRNCVALLMMLVLKLPAEPLVGGDRRSAASGPRTARPAAPAADAPSSRRGWRGCSARAASSARRDARRRRAPARGAASTPRPSSWPW